MDLSLNGVSLASAVPSAYVQDVVEQIVGQRRYSTVLIAGRPGSWRYDEEPGDRLIRVPILINTGSVAARIAATDALAYWADIGTSAALIRSDRPTWRWDALLSNNNEIAVKAGRASVELDFLVGPYREAISLSSQAVTATTNPDTDTFSIGDTVNADPVVELTPAGGSFTATSLTVNGYTLTWSGDAILAGETLTISAISDTVLRGANNDVNLTGTFDAADVDMADAAGQFPVLLPGSNTWTLSWTGTATSVAVNFTWRERTR